MLKGQIFLGVIFATLLYVQAQHCNEGGFKSVGCNQCFCREREWACTSKDCTKGNQQMKECTHGAAKTQSCNKCSCMYGFWACTSKPCGGSGVGFHPPTSYNNTHNQTPHLAAECFTGQTKKVDCNTCTCQNGLWDCTKIDCAIINSMHLPGECTAGMTKMQDCNRCSCLNGRWDCTKFNCGPSTSPTNNLYPNLPPMECMNGQTKVADDGCNRCSCLGGKWACTLHACAPQIQQLNANTVLMPCRDGDKAKYNCNDCQCLGTAWACTSARC